SRNARAITRSGRTRYPTPACIVSSVITVCYIFRQQITPYNQLCGQRTHESVLPHFADLNG
ncbi:hypothetical protein, partial [Escherichia coli]|uniref:hypothetical protein n=1 Tax=Escherichia coli TaxID=562 RepID=UPI001BFCD35C